MTMSQPHNQGMTPPSSPSHYSGLNEDFESKSHLGNSYLKKNCKMMDQEDHQNKVSPSVPACSVFQREEPLLSTSIYDTPYALNNNCDASNPMDCDEDPSYTRSNEASVQIIPKILESDEYGGLMYPEDEKAQIEENQTENMEIERMDIVTEANQQGSAPISHDLFQQFDKSFNQEFKQVSQWWSNIASSSSYKPGVYKTSVAQEKERDFFNSLFHTVPKNYFHQDSARKREGGKTPSVTSLSSSTESPEELGESKKETVYKWQNLTPQNFSELDRTKSTPEPVHNSTIGEIRGEKTENGTDFLQSPTSLESTASPLAVLESEGKTPRERPTLAKSPNSSPPTFPQTPPITPPPPPPPKTTSFVAQLTSTSPKRSATTTLQALPTRRIAPPTRSEAEVNKWKIKSSQWANDVYGGAIRRYFQESRCPPMANLEKVLKALRDMYKARNEIRKTDLRPYPNPNQHLCILVKQYIGFSNHFETIRDEEAKKKAKMIERWAEKVLGVLEEIERGM